MKATPASSLATAEAKISSLLISAELEGRAVEVLRECMEATIVGRAGRDEHGISYAERPDFPTRLAAAVKTIEFARGRPGTSLAVAITPPGAHTGKSDLVAMLAAMPADYLEKRFREIAEQVRKVAPIDIAGE